MWICVPKGETGLLTQIESSKKWGGDPSCVQGGAGESSESKQQLHPQEPTAYQNAKGCCTAGAHLQRHLHATQMPKAMPQCALWHVALPPTLMSCQSVRRARTQRKVSLSCETFGLMTGTKNIWQKKKILQHHIPMKMFQGERGWHRWVILNFHQM